MYGMKQEFSTIDDGYSLTPQSDAGAKPSHKFYLYLYINSIHHFVLFVKSFLHLYVKVFIYRVSVGTRIPEQFLPL